MDIKIEHQPDQQRFISIIEGHKCYLTYRITKDPNVWDFNHTYTEPALRGQGIMGKITVVALDYARANGIKVIPGCPYVKDFVEKHPEYQDMLA